MDLTFHLCYEIRFVRPCFFQWSKAGIIFGPSSISCLDSFKLQSSEHFCISTWRHFFGFVSQREGVLGKCRDAPQLLQPSIVTSKVKVKEEVKENGDKKSKSPGGKQSVELKPVDKKPDSEANPSIDPPINPVKSKNSFEIHGI